MEKILCPVQCLLTAVFEAMNTLVKHTSQRIHEQLIIFITAPSTVYPHRLQWQFQQTMISETVTSQRIEQP